jgi:hypothetical protein
MGDPIPVEMGFRLRQWRAGLSPCPLLQNPTAAVASFHCLAEKREMLNRNLHVSRCIDMGIPHPSLTVLPHTPVQCSLD